MSITSLITFPARTKLDEELFALPFPSLTDEGVVGALNTLRYLFAYEYSYHISLVFMAQRNESEFRLSTNKDRWFDGYDNRLTRAEHNLRNYVDNSGYSRLHAYASFNAYQVHAGMPSYKGIEVPTLEQTKYLPSLILEQTLNELWPWMESKDVLDKLKFSKDSLDSSRVAKALYYVIRGQTVQCLRLVTWLDSKKGRFKTALVTDGRGQLVQFWRREYDFNWRSCQFAEARVQTPY